jgi:hypothetical protein
MKVMLSLWFATAHGFHMGCNHGCSDDKLTQRFKFLFGCSSRLFVWSVRSSREVGLRLFTRHLVI